MIEFGEFKLSDIGREYVNEVFEKNWLTMGDMTRRFEEAFASQFNYPFCRMTSSGTMANACALMALLELGASRGDEIICPALSFIASGTSIVLAGFKPVFVDVDNHMNIDEGRIERAITPKTRAILAVNLMGRPAELDVIRDIADHHRLYVIVDNCEGYGAKYKGKFSLEYADFETTSHFSAHITNCGLEGGSVLTKDRYFDQLIEGIRSHGRMGGSTYFDHSIFGINAKPNDVAAAIALGEVNDFWKTFEIRKNNFNFLKEELAGYEHIVEFTTEDHNRVNAPHAFNIIFKNPSNTMKFYREVGDKLHLKKTFGSIPTRHKAMAYLGHRWGEFPKAEYIGENSWHFGVHQHLKEDELVQIVEMVKTSFKGMRR